MLDVSTNHHEIRKHYGGVSRVFSIRKIRLPISSPACVNDFHPSSTRNHHSQSQDCGVEDQSHINMATDRDLPGSYQIMSGELTRGINSRSSSTYFTVTK